MDNMQHILPIPHEVTIIYDLNSISDIHNTEIYPNIESQKNYNVFKNLYNALFTKKIDYDTIYPKINIILEQIHKSDNVREYSDCIENIFKIELLCDNFYHKLIKGINTEAIKKYNIKFLDLKYPHIIRENSLDLDFLIIKIENDEILYKNLGNYIICYKINQELSRLSNEILANDCTSFKNLFVEKVIIDDRLLCCNNPPYLLLYLINLEHRKYLPYIIQDNFRTSNHAYFFFKNVDVELIYDKSIGELSCNDKFQLLQQHPSHMLVNKYFDDLKHHNKIDKIIIRSYYYENPHTIDLLHKMFEFNIEMGEKILKRIILLHKEKKFKSLFFAKCTNIDIEFIEIFILYLGSISKIDNDLFRNVILSPYFGILSNSIKVFEECIDRSVKLLNNNDIHKIINSLFYEKMRIKEDTIHKMEYLLQKFPDTKEIMFQKFETVLKILEKRNLGNFEPHDSFYSNDSRISISDTSNIKIYIYKVINLLRSETKIIKYADFIINYDFPLFLDYCLFQNNKLIDQFFVKFINKILSLSDIIKYDTFSTRFVEYIASYKNIDYYWNIAAMKEIDLDKLLLTIKDSCQNEMFCVKYIYNEMYLMKLLNEEFRASSDIIDYSKIEEIIKRLEVFAKYQSGMVFHNSFIKFEVESRDFCLYFIAIQYDLFDEQSIIKFENCDTSIDLTLTDGKIILKKYKGTFCERILLNSDIFVGGKIQLIFKYSKRKLKIIINTKKYYENTNNITKITIGKFFKGTIQRIVYYENSHFRNDYLLRASKFNYIFDLMCDLEKKLLFRNENGFYLYNSVPYFFNKKIEIQIFNVLYNFSLKWIHNLNLCDKIFNRSKCDIKVANIMQKYIELAYLDLKYIR